MLTLPKRLLAPLVLLAGLASCGSDAGATSNTGPIAGHWSQETGTDKTGMTLEFDADSDKLLVHTAPEEDGSHEHLEGTYSIDAAGTVTVKCALNGTGKGDTWTGKLDGDHLKLANSGTTFTYHKGKDPHGH